MAIAAPSSDIAAPERRLPVGDGQGRREEDLLAEYFVERAKDLPDSKKAEFLQQIPAHLRRFHGWFRDSIVLPVMESIDPKSGEENVRQKIIHALPEFFGDAKARKAAGMYSSSPEAMHHAAMGRSGYLFAKEPPLEGAPYSDRSPVKLESHPRMNGNARLGMCDVCGDKGVSLTYAAFLVVQGIRTLQVETCSKCEEALSQKLSCRDPSIFPDVYAHAKPA